MSPSEPNRDEIRDSLTVDRLCDAFEDALRKDRHAKLEPFLEQVQEESRPHLFEQLLYLELEFKTDAVMAEYVERFPPFRIQIRSIFEELKLVHWVGSTVGPFEILQEIARGGMGVVYLARDSRLDRQIAIKMINRERRNDSRWMRRFRREARLASHLNHPNIVTIFEIGEVEGAHYIACEYVDGVTLKKYVGGKPLSPKSIVDFAQQISSGMSAAHDAGIIHRDLKAENVMIRHDQLLKILDFGLAKETEGGYQPLTRTGVITGSVHFMSPEQARGQELTTATDVFSFGIVLYLMATGKLPFSGDTSSDVLVSVLNREPIRISDHGVSVDPVMEGLIAECLKKDASERPSFDVILRKLAGLSGSQQSTWSRRLAEDRTSGRSRGDSTSENSLTELMLEEGELRPSSIRYAKSGNVNIAWQDIGEGPIDVVFVMGWVSHLEWFWKDPSFARFLRQLASFSRVILFDKRGTGLSDKVPINELPDLESRMDDVRAVMDAAGSSKAVLCGVSEGGPLCALFAATFPEKTIALTMIGSYSRRLWAEDYPWGPKEEQRELFLQEIGTQWGGPLGLEDRAPSMVHDARFREWWGSYLRMGASPGAAVALTKMNAEIDIRPILSSIRVPSLVIHRSGDRCLKVEEGRYLAEQIPNAKFAELPGEDHLPFVGDSQGIVDEIKSFLDELAGSQHSDLVLASVLSIRVEDRGDSRLCQRFLAAADGQFRRYRGKVYPTGEATEVGGLPGTALLVSFDGPVRSVMCAVAIIEFAKNIQLNVACGLDIGACTIQGAEMRGPPVDAAERIARLIPSGVLMTQSLKNLIAGSQLSIKPWPGEPRDGFPKDALFEATSRP
ncbi:MAG: alpha/beta fold hydrolase [Planctomycetota bacterium]